MTDDDLIAKKLAFIETCVRELVELANPEALESDVRERRFVEHTLQLAIQAALDVASHIVSDKRLGEPQSNRQLFELLQVDNWVSESQIAPLRNMAGFRNILVHGYTAVDPGIIRNILEERLTDLTEFAATIRDRLKSEA